MSDSPKYTRTRLDEREERRLRDERRRQAELERKRRAEEEKHRAVARLNKARKAALLEAEALGCEIRKVSSSVVAAFIEGKQIQDWQTRLSWMERSLQSAPSEGEVRRIARELGQLQDEIRRTVATVEAIQVAVRGVQEETSTLEQELLVLSQRPFARFCRNSQVDVLRGRLRRIRQAVDAAQTEDALNQVNRDLHAFRKDMGRLKGECDAAERAMREAREEATLLQQELAHMLRSDSARFVKPPGILEELLRQAQNAGNVLERFVAEDGVSDVLKQLSRIRKEMLEVRKQAEHRYRASQGAFDVLKLLEEELRACDEPENDRFIPKERVTAIRRNAITIRRALESSSELEVAQEAHRTVSELRKELREILAVAHAVRRTAATIQQEVTALQRNATTFSTSEAAQHVPPHNLDNLLTRISHLAANVKSIRTEEEFREVGREIRNYRQQFQRLVADAEAALLATKLNQGEAALTELKRRLASADHRLSEKFDPHGLQAVKDAVHRAESLLKSQAVVEASEQIAHGAELLDSHLAAVDQAHTHWREQKRDAEAAVAHTGNLLTTLRVDPAVARWSAREAHELAQKLANAEELLVLEQFAQARAEATKVADEVNELTRAVQELQAVSSEVEELRCHLAQLDHSLSEKFDPGAMREITNCLDEVARHLECRETLKARYCLAEAWQRLARHQGLIDECYSRWKVEKEKAEASVAAAADCLTVFQPSSPLHPWGKRDLPALQERLESARKLLNEEQFNEACQESAAVREQAESLLELAKELQLESLAINELQQRIGALDLARSQKFDPRGLEEVEAQTKAAAAHLQNRSLSAARQAVAVARQRLDVHQQVVAAAFTRWSQDRDNAGIVLDDVRDRLAALHSDPVVSRWVSAELAELNERLEKAALLFERDRFDQAHHEAIVIGQAIEPLIAKSQELQLKEDRRQYIVSGFLETLRQFGFVVDQPTLEYPDWPTSAVIIKAERPAGGAIAVSVPQEGEVQYDLAGNEFPKRVETGSSGQLVNTCDEAEQLLLALHGVLLDKFGIETGELMWKGKDPLRISRTAQQLPGTEPRRQARRQ